MQQTKMIRMITVHRNGAVFEREIATNNYQAKNVMREAKKGLSSAWQKNENGAYVKQCDGYCGDRGCMTAQTGGNWS